MPKKEKPTKAPTYAAPALEKGLDILELLSGLSQPMGLSDISQAVGRSKNEIFRMLHVLEKRHYIERAQGNDLYTLTNRLFLLGMERPPLKGLLDIALPMLHELSDDTQQSCHLVVPSEQFMVVIARIDPPADLGLVVRIGHRRPILEGTSGMVLTAFQLEPVRQRWIEDYGADMTPKSRAELENRLADITRKGFAAIKSTVVPGITDISVPVMSNGAAVASLAIPYMKRSGVPVSQTEATTMARTVAAAISARLP
ncbi:IclR family transcriptional regulator [Hephaestia sp. GCM10023244]|uniref:IclR family transcriptional regulator n=1 Tax=unclassified Hephaestia TaxID=2631281 RepID=UPI002076D7BF|nr:IclR family transcriptional regulator [Hephaestia sp. MAHUQ-44]MCM8730273.1 IclR family transcriptional regulator [Hephaestia sp. MAHUQ-44]